MLRGNPAAGSRARDDLIVDLETYDDGIVTTPLDDAEAATLLLALVARLESLEPSS